MIATVETVESIDLLNNKCVTVAADSISFLEVNALNSEIFLAINRIQYLWRQRADTSNIFKEITNIDRYHRMTKDFLQDHNNEIISEEKINNKISRNKKLLNKINIEPLNE